MLYLRTGTPGSGKTLSTIDELRKITDRPIYYHGIPDLKLDWKKIDDPLNYHNEIPDGSIFVLDECQKYFPVRSPKDSVPPAISFIETHRHRGIDLYFITQHPSLLDHHARRLVGHHTHLQRNFGMSFAMKYTNNKLFDSTNYHELQTCEKTRYSYPKEVFTLYKSAEVHTVKPKLPKKLLLIFPLLAMMVGGAYYIFDMLSSRSPEVSETSSVMDVKQSSSMLQPVPESVKKIDWGRAYVPEIQGAPYTAPIYQELAKPRVMPVVTMCWSSPQECHCYTQQASRVDMPDDMCRTMVKHRTFNAFKQARDDDSDRHREYKR